MHVLAEMPKVIGKDDWVVARRVDSIHQHHLALLLCNMHPLQQRWGKLADGVARLFLLLYNCKRQVGVPVRDEWHDLLVEKGQARRRLCRRWRRWRLVLLVLLCARKEAFLFTLLSLRIQTGEHCGHICQHIVCPAQVPAIHAHLRTLAVDLTLPGAMPIGVA